MIQSPMKKRAERRDRNKTSLDMNLVSLIDIFTKVAASFTFVMRPLDRSSTIQTLSPRFR